MSSNLSEDPNAFRELEFSGWQRVVEKYHAVWGNLTGQTGLALLDTLGVGQATMFLDVATGPGYVARLAANREAEVTGVDLSPLMVRKARELSPGLNFREGDAENLPFKEETFDVVSMNFGMLHLSNPTLAIKEAFRVLKPGGSFGFTVWDSPEKAVGFSLILRAVGEVNQQIKIPHGPDFFYYSDPTRSRVALADAGFVNPDVRFLDLIWHLESMQDLFPAFFYGAVRTGAILRALTEGAREKVANRVTKLAAQYQYPDGHLEIPMPALLASGMKK